MSPIALRARMRRCRRHAAALALMLVLAAAVAVHHSPPAIGDPHHGADVAAIAEMCLGAFSAVGAALAAVAFGLIALGRWRPAMALAPAGILRAAREPEPRARAGPALLTLLCVSRR